MMKHRISLVVIIATIVLTAIGLYLFLNLTDPLAAGPVGLLTVFVLIYLLCFATLLLVTRLLEMVYHLMRSTATVVKEDKMRLWRRRATYIAAALSFMPIFLVSLNSIGQLGFRDIALVVIIEGLLIFYIIRRV